MPALDFDTFTDMLKIDYVDGLNDNDNKSAVLLNLLPRNHELTGGKETYLPILRRHNPAVGSRNAGETLPTPSYARFKKVTFAIETIYGRGQVDAKLARGSGADKYAFTDALDSQLQSLAIALPAERNRMLYGNGSGVLAKMTSTAALSNKTTFFVDSIQYLAIEDRVTVASAADGSGTSSTTTREITDINDSTYLVTLDAGITTVTTSTFGLFRDRSQGREMFGLLNSHYTTNPAFTGVDNFGFLDRTVATNKFFQGNLLHNSGTNRPLSLGLMQQAKMTQHTKGKGVTRLLVSAPDEWNTHGNLLVADRRWNDKLSTLDGGWPALDFLGSPHVFDKDCPPNRIFFLDTSTIGLLEYEAGYQFMESDGSILRYASAGDIDQVVFCLLKDHQFFATQCNNQAVLVDIAVNIN